MFDQVPAVCCKCYPGITVELLERKSQSLVCLHGGIYSDCSRPVLSVMYLVLSAVAKEVATKVSSLRVPLLSLGPTNAECRDDLLPASPS